MGFRLFFRLFELCLLAAALYGCGGGGSAAVPVVGTVVPTAGVAVVSPVAAVSVSPTVAATAVRVVSPTAAVVSPVAAASPVVAVASPVVASPAVGTAVAGDVGGIECAAWDGGGAVPAEIGEVIEELGFAVRPFGLPAGFRLAGVSSNKGEFRQIYASGARNIIVAYPIEFSADARSGPLGWERPEDAVSGVDVGGGAVAYLMVGGWSDASIIAGPALSPDRAEWDYEKSLALFFVCPGGGGDVPVAIQALPEPGGWIDADGLLDVARSLRRVSGGR